jgi:hypothetical protein
MTTRQIVTTLIWVVALFGAVRAGAAASQQPAAEVPGAIRGVVTRVGTRESLDGARVTLQGGAANPQAIQVLVNTAASQGIVVKPEPGASTSQIIQAWANAAIARVPIDDGEPVHPACVPVREAPPTTTTDSDGRFLQGCQPGPTPSASRRKASLGNEGGVNPPT